MKDLSIILPHVEEWPMAAFTVREIAEELRGSGIDFELIAVDNYSDTVKKQDQAKLDGMKNKDGTPGPFYGYMEQKIANARRAGGQFSGVMKGHSWLKALEYGDKLSHWQAKNHAVQCSSGRILWFCDAHCMIMRDSLVRMYRYYDEHHEELNGTLHLPLTYHIMEYHKLIYKLVTNWDKNEVAYSFTPFRESEETYRVPCMSTCGMMMTRELYDLVGGWPTELGIYGGGEHFMNFTLAVLGKSINIFPAGVLYHHGDKRGYHWYYDDHLRNKIIAAYLYGGVEFSRKFAQSSKGRPRVLNNMWTDVVDKCSPHRDLIKSRQVTTIREWAKEWGR